MSRNCYSRFVLFIIKERFLLLDISLSLHHLFPYRWLLYLVLQFRDQYCTLWILVICARISRCRSLSSLSGANLHASWTNLSPLASSIASLKLKIESFSMFGAVLWLCSEQLVSIVSRIWESNLGLDSVLENPGQLKDWFSCIEDRRSSVMKYLSSVLPVSIVNMRSRYKLLKQWGCTFGSLTCLQMLFVFDCS